MPNTTNYEKYLAYLHDVCSPRHFIKWNYLFSISAILARKVWIGDETSRIFPNLYLIFVGPPGVGKTWPAELTRELLNALKEVRIVPGTTQIIENPLVNLAPQSLTLERMYDRMASSTEAIPFPNEPTKRYIHSSITFYHTEELTTLFHKNQDDLVDFFVQGWNGGSFKRETKSSGNADIMNMCINLCSCTTAKRLSDCMSANLLSEGFTSRTIFIYGDKVFHDVPIFKPTPEAKEGLKDVKKHWKDLGKLFGEVKLEGEALEWLHHWIKTRMRQNLNKDKRLAEYYVRKKHHLIKIATACHFREKLTMRLDVEDFVEAEKECELIEVDMHKALKSMGINPLHRLAEDIKSYLEANGPTSKNRILVDFFDGGNHKEIQEALDHKCITGEFQPFMDEKTGRESYKYLNGASEKI